MLSNIYPVLQEQRNPKKGGKSAKGGGLDLANKPAWLDQAVKEFKEREAAKKSANPEVIDTSDD